MDRIYARFSDEFENNYISQSFETNRSIEETLELGWDLLSILPKNELTRIDEKYIDRYYRHEIYERYRTEMN